MSKVTCPDRSPGSLFISGSCRGKRGYSSSDFTAQSPNGEAMRKATEERRLGAELTAVF